MEAGPVLNEYTLVSGGMPKPSLLLSAKETPPTVGFLHSSCMPKLPTVPGVIKRT